VSNFLAIATVTAALGQLLQAAVGTDVPGATVALARPANPPGNNPAPAVNLYLFQVSPNAAWRNTDLPARREGGDLVQRPRVAVDLHYLLTFYGDEAQLEPQRLLGIALRTLHARPVLTREMIRATIADQSFDYLAASDLAEEVELVRFTPSALTLEELSKLWSVFFQTPHALSVAYQASVVLIESEDVAPPPALPVRRAGIYVLPFGQPAIERVQAAGGPQAPIVAGSTLSILGRRLRGTPTQVRFGDVLVAPPPSDVGDTRITVGVPAGARAGIQGVQVVHPVLMGEPPAEHRGAESNVAAFVLRPTITVAVTGVAGTGDQPRSANVDVSFNPAVGRSQRVVLLLNEFHPPPDRPARAYHFAAPAPAAPGPAATRRIPISGVAAGTYLVRVQVDGAESLLRAGSGGDYDAPQVTL
jgi:hypothetical protein